jgi:hypothetical protein
VCRYCIPYAHHCQEIFFTKFVLFSFCPTQRAIRATAYPSQAGQAPVGEVSSQTLVDSLIYLRPASAYQCLLSSKPGQSPSRFVVFYLQGGEFRRASAGETVYTAIFSQILLIPIIFRAFAFRICDCVFRWRTIYRSQSGSMRHLVRNFGVKWNVSFLSTSDDNQTLYH